MPTRYYTAASLDGFIATSDHRLDWLFQFGDAASQGYEEFIRDVGALAMGSSTYEWVCRELAREAGGGPVRWPYAQPSFVFTTRALPRVEGGDVRFVQGEVRPVHAEMTRAAAGKDLWIVGGGDLAGQFHDAGLLDEIIVTIASVTLGSGQPLLPRAIVAPPMRLLSVRQFGEGFAELRYAITRKDGTS